MSSSRVMHFPPALVILALAASVNLSAATVSFGTSIILSSSVTVETTTTVLSCFSPRCFTSLVRERGGLLTLDEQVYGGRSCRTWNQFFLTRTCRVSRGGDDK